MRVSPKGLWQRKWDRSHPLDWITPSYWSAPWNLTGLAFRGRPKLVRGFAPTSQWKVQDFTLADALEQQQQQQQSAEEESTMFLWTEPTKSYSHRDPPLGRMESAESSRSWYTLEFIRNKVRLVRSWLWISFIYLTRLPSLPFSIFFLNKILSLTKNTGLPLVTREQNHRDLSTIDKKPLGPCS